MCLFVPRWRLKLKMETIKDANFHVERQKIRNMESSHCRENLRLIQQRGVVNGL